MKNISWNDGVSAELSKLHYHEVGPQRQSWIIDVVKQPRLKSSENRFSLHAKM